MLKTAFLVHSTALAMSVALDMTQDAHKTLPVAEHGTTAALPETVISCTHCGHSFTRLFFLPQPYFRLRWRTTVSPGTSARPGKNDCSSKIPAKPRAYAPQVLKTEAGKGEGRAHELTWGFRDLCWVPLVKQLGLQQVW